MPRTLQINDQYTKRLKSGYPWVFRSDFITPAEVKDLEPGQIVDFVRKSGEFIGRGFVNPNAGQLTGRILTRKPEEAIDADFIRRRLEVALNYRNKIFKHPCYRLIHAESDGFPGLIIDRFGDVIAAQVNTAGMEALWPHIETALRDLINPKEIILKNDTANRASEGLEQSVTALSGKIAAGDLTEITEGNTKFYVDVINGQKTGWFYDQRDNRAWAAECGRGGTFIDVFCHTGGFGITAVNNGATHVTFVDSSAPALEMVKKNAALNNAADKCETICGMAFPVLEDLAKQGKTYNFVCVDPPAFVKVKKDLAAGLQGYKKLARLAAPLVAPNGFMLFASCSSHVSEEELISVTTEGINTYGRRFQLVKTGGAGPDHPVHPQLPETRYLKALTYRFMD